MIHDVQRLLRFRRHYGLYALALVVGFAVTSGLALHAARGWWEHSTRAGGAEAGASLAPASLSGIADFPLYSVGDQYDGLPLTKVIRHVSPSGTLHPEDLVLLMYGSCTPSADGGGCAVPLSIRIEPVCNATPASFSAAAFSGDVLSVRGTTARTVGGHLQLWTAQVSISIYARDAATRMDAASRLANITGLPIPVTNAANTPVAAASELGPTQVGMFVPQTTAFQQFSPALCG